MTRAAEYLSSRELFTHLTLRELRSKYKRSALGWAWSLVNPLASMGIFTIVFRFFLKVQPPRGHAGLQVFALFLLCGLLPWTYLQNGVTGSIGALVANANLIKKTYFPRELLVAANVASMLVSHLIEMGLLAVVLALFGNFKLVLYLPVVIVLILLLTLYTTGLGLMFSVVNVYFRDVQHFMAILFQLWFYATPIVYPLTLVPKKGHVFGVLLPVRRLLDVNPMTDFVQAFRACLYDVRMPSAGAFAYIAAVSLATFALGLFVFGRLEGRLAEEL
jgi:ABC-type polysaccharide/polyol phosphate export permease